MTKHNALPGSLETAHDVSITYRYIVPAGHTLEMCRDPEYWKHNLRECNQQRIGGRHAWNKIELLAVDGQWEAMLRIISVDLQNGIVETRLLSQWPEPVKAAAPVVEAEAPKGYRVEFIEGNGWRAIEPGGTTLIEKRPARDEAVRRAIEHNSKVKGGK